MTASPFAAQLTSQIGEEFAAHQQYLAKVPNGYRCHANTGVPFPRD